MAVVEPEPAGPATARAHGIPPGRFHDSPQAMLAAESNHLPMAGSPNQLHPGHLRLGLAAGSKILCEEPVVVTAMADRLELSAQPTDQVMVGLVMRQAPLFVDLRRAIAKGLLGGRVSTGASEQIAHWHGAFFMPGWRRDDPCCGSFLPEKCCHAPDLYTAVKQCRPARVARFGGRKSFAPQTIGANDLSICCRRPSGRGGSDRGFDSHGDIVDFQTAIIEYVSGAGVTFPPCMNVPDQFRRFCVRGAQGTAKSDFVRDFL